MASQIWNPDPAHRVGSYTMPPPGSRQTAQAPTPQQWGGWNTQNIWDYEAINEQAKQGVFDKSRDEIANQRDAFIQDYERRFHDAAAQGGYREEGATGLLFQDPRFRSFVQTGQYSAPPQSPSQSWSNSQTQTNVNNAVQQSAENKARGDSLWEKLAELVGQSTDVTKSPVIQAQTDAFAAEQERSRRNAVTSIAERYGPYANTLGEERMLAERAGQATGGFRAQAMSNELTNIRNQIMQSLQMQGQFLDADRRASMGEAVAQIDAQLRQLGMNQQYDLGLRNLGLQDWDRQMYWDLIQRGMI